MERKRERETGIVIPDYKTIQAISRRIDCTVTEADFYTSYPNANRIKYTANDINRYLKYTGGNF